MATENREFRKKPVVVEAVQWFKHGDHPMVQPYAEGTISHYPKYAECGYIKTLESGQTMHHVIPGDWIIRGVKGEHYPCKPDIFAATYEPAVSRPSDAPAQSSEARPGVGNAVESDTADKTGVEMGKVNRVEDDSPDQTVPFGCVRAREHLRGEAHDCKAGSAETGGGGGEKA